MSTTQGIQGAMAIVLATVKAIGPATARSIEQHPEVVAACRSSKTKARRLIDRLQRLGQIQSDGAAQMPKFSTKEAPEIPPAADEARLTSASIPTKLASPFG